MLELLLDWSRCSPLGFGALALSGRSAKGSKSGSRTVGEDGSLGPPLFLFGRNAFHHLVLSVVIVDGREGAEAGTDASVTMSRWRSSSKWQLGYNTKLAFIIHWPVFAFIYTFIKRDNVTTGFIVPHTVQWNSKSYYAIKERRCYKRFCNFFLLSSITRHSHVPYLHPHFHYKH